MLLNSELHIPQWLKCLPFVLLTALGVGLRFYHLESFPYGLDSDQAKVLLWGHKAVSEGQVRVYTDEETGFEAFASYLFAGAEQLLGSPEHPGLVARKLAALFSLLDLFLLGLLLYRHGWLSVWQGISLLATCPWAIYYARIVGPCVGISGILLLELWVTGLKARLGLHFAGLLYYSLYRLAWLYDLTQALLRRQNKLAWRLCVPLFFVFAIGVVEGLVTGRSPEARGIYNLPVSFEAIWLRILGFFQMWFWGPGEALQFPNPAFVIDPVSVGFARFLGGGPALGLGLIPLFLAALYSIPNYRANLRDEKEMRILGLFLFVFVLLILSPTYSHGLMILPLIPYLIVRILGPLAARKEKLAVLFGVALIMAGLSGAVQSFLVLESASHRGEQDMIQSDRLRDLFEMHILKETEGSKISFFTGQQLHQARYWGQNLGRRGRAVGIYPGLDIQDMHRILEANWFENPRQILYFDIQDIKYPWAEVPEFYKPVQDLQQFRNQIEQRYHVAERQDIQIWGQVVARRYLVEKSAPAQPTQ